MLPRCLKTETRKRAASPKAKPKSVLPVSCNSCWQRSGVMLFIRAVRVGRLEHLGLEPLHAAVETQHRRLADRDVQIARPLLDAGREQLVDENRAHGSIIPLQLRIYAHAFDDVSTGELPRQRSDNALSAGSDGPHLRASVLRLATCRIGQGSLFRRIASLHANPPRDVRE